MVFRCLMVGGSADGEMVEVRDYGEGPPNTLYFEDRSDITVWLEVPRKIEYRLMRMRYLYPEPIYVYTCLACATVLKDIVEGYHRMAQELKHLRGVT